MTSVTLRKISKSFGKIEAVNEVDLKIEDRELVVIVGPSGCGKSTLLRMIAGLEEITSGALLIGETPMTNVTAADRGIAMVFQSYALYPHMTAAENMGFALKMLGVQPDEINQKVLEAANILQIKDLLDRKPRELSGGQRQRVAIGRAIVRKPDVFLFDEPLSNLDADLRAQMRVEIARLHKQLEATTIYVTHDQVEAMTLADRIVILNNGRVEQEGPPLHLFEKPANRFVAGFLGQPKMNFLPVVVRKRRDGIDFLVSLGGVSVASIPDRPDLIDGQRVEIGVRPDAFTFPEKDGLPAEISLVERLGSTSLLHMQVAGLDDLLKIEQPGNISAVVGAKVQLHLDPARIHIFDKAGKRVG